MESMDHHGENYIMEPEEARQRFIQSCDTHKEFITEIDGFVYWWPKRTGYLSAYQLRHLADELDKRNKEWEDNINSYFENDET